MERLFARVEVPHHHRHNGAARHAQWYSWDGAVRDLMAELRKPIAALRAPRCISVRGCSPYASTYSYLSSDLGRPLRSVATDLATALLRTRVDRRLRFFSGLLDHPMTSTAFHKYLALIRTGLVRITGDPRTALHAPVKPERSDDGFPLHTDLFVTERLLLIFDRVPRDQSGKTLLLSNDAFDAIIRSNELIPPTVRKRIRVLLQRKTAQDSFDEFFDLVHAREHPWSESLARAMESSALRIKLRRGEGYLLHDGRWLHGRTPASGAITPERFRRLVYGPFVPD